MPPKQPVFCRVCNFDHPRPVGRNCKPSAAATSAVSHQGPPVSQDLTANPQVSASVQSFAPDVASAILAKLDSIDQRVASNERALAAQLQSNQHSSNSLVSCGLPENESAYPGPG